LRSGFASGNSRAVLAPGVTELPDAKLRVKEGAVCPPTCGPVFFLDATQFAFAPPRSTGMGRNMFTGPGYWDVDASVSKVFNITERLKTKFSLEAFNAMNHTNYRSLADATVGSTSINNANFGQACCQT